MGSIPYNIGDLDSLSYLYLDNNDFTGEIPGSIGNLTNLKKLSLYNNNFSGQIPENICNIYTINFQHLYLHNNKLCPGPTGYPECIPGNHLGMQYCSP